MLPAHYSGFKIFEPNLTAAGDHTCAGFGFPKYDNTVTHGFGPVSMTLDLYDPKDKDAAAASGPCCETCQAPQAKYISVDTAHGHCGEACMYPLDITIEKVTITDDYFNLFHVVFSTSGHPLHPYIILCCFLYMSLCILHCFYMVLAGFIHDILDC